MKSNELNLREIQLASLKILEDIDNFCRNNSIKYFIFFGTLIGAVRHKGFIPWDDDIDIAMPRSDYDRFLKEYGKDGKYRLVNYENDNHCPFMITRISDDSYKLFSKYGPNYKIGTFIDVYPLDGVGNDVLHAKIASKFSRKYASRLSKSLERNIYGVVNDTHHGLKKWILLFTYIIPKLKGSSFYREKLLELRNQYPEYNNSKYVGCVTWAMLASEYFQREWFEQIIDMKFENIIVMGPAEYDKVLTQNFGNYMELPPVKDRIAHHYYKIYKARNC